jgi:hypothetical protein
LYLFAAVAPAGGQQDHLRPIYDGETFRVPNQTHSYAKNQRWQVWLYQSGVRIPQYPVSRQYSSWGLMEGGSPERVIKELQDAQRFEELYLRFFGPGTWGRYTFSNAQGSVAIAGHTIESDTTALEMRSQLNELRSRVNRLITSAQASLENNESQGPKSPHKEYFDQIRDALQQVSKLAGQLARPTNQVHYLGEEFARIGKVVGQAEKDLPKMEASLPSVKLPASTRWMFHTERAGSDGTILVEFTESGSGISVQQTWTGGDGGMAGTVSVTTIPFHNIARVELRPPMTKGGETSTVFVQAGGDSFPETVSSPVRHWARRILPAVNLTTTKSFLYFTFRDPADAQDAYTYFLYHQQVGR